jgi:hypothetical protein
VQRTPYNGGGAFAGALDEPPRAAVGLRGRR